MSEAHLKIVAGIATLGHLRFDSPSFVSNFEILPQLPIQGKFVDSVSNPRAKSYKEQCWEIENE